jgi:hypothetical protein
MEIISVRLDPKLRYLADLAARKQRRALSNFIEWAVEQALKRVYLRENIEAPHLNISVASKASDLWDVHEADRFVKLAYVYPELLTHEEHVLWKLIRNNDCFWRTYDEADVPPIEKRFNFDSFREYWDKFKAVARGDADISTLPTLPATGSKPKHR